MTVVGDLERLFAALYPYRVPLVILVLVAAAAVLRAAVRRDWFAPARRHPRLTAAAAVAGLILALPLGNYLLSPLWTTVELTEASPLDTSAAGSAAIVAEGQFVGADAFHFGEGAVKIVETDADLYTLRFEEFSVRNGPDLYVYLSPSADGYAEGALELGVLKATDGSFNYELPAGVDPAAYGSVIIWCKQFSVLFATATL